MKKKIINHLSVLFLSASCISASISCLTSCGDKQPYVNSDKIYSVKENGDYLIYNIKTLCSNSSNIEATNQRTSSVETFSRDFFNEPIKFGKQLKNIGDYFLANCKLFNHSIVLPNSIQNIGTHFLYNCDEMVSSVDCSELGCDIFSESDYSFSSSSKAAKSYSNGISVLGKNYGEIIRKFYDRNDSSPYRKVTNSAYIKAQSINIIGKESMAVGDTFRMKFHFSPNNASYQNVEWSTDNKNVLSIDPTTGNVNAKKYGNANITARALDGSNLKKTFPVLVGDMYITADTNVPAGNNCIFHAYPRGQTSIQNLQWSVIGVLPSGCTFNNGVLATSLSTPKGSTVTIKAMSDNCGSATKTVTIDYAEAQSVQFINPISEIWINGESKLEAKIEPIQAEQNIDWSSSNPSKLSIDKNGNIKAGATSGTVTITAKSNKYKTILNTINIDVASIKINGNDNCPINGNIDFSLSKLPSGDAIAAKWTYDDSLMLTGSSITSTGNFTAGEKPGVVKITGTTTDGSEKSASIYVSVGQKFSNMTWSTIGSICKFFEDNPTISSNVTSKCFLKDDNTPYLTWQEMVGLTREISVNYVSHKIRIIGTGADDETKYQVDKFDDGVIEKKCALTFEFVNLLSDSSGNSLATLYNDSLDLNYNYLNSTIRKNLVGEGGAEISWYQKDSSYKSATYANKTVIDMISDATLKSLFKKSKRQYDYDVNYADKLFLADCGNYRGSAHRTNNKIYSFYHNHIDNIYTVRKDVTNKDGGTVYTKNVVLRDSKLAIKESGIETYYNGAGMNYASDMTKGCSYWNSTSTTYYGCVGWTTSSGEVVGDTSSSIYINENTHCILPCFCI